MAAAAARPRFLKFIEIKQFCKFVIGEFSSISICHICRQPGNISRFFAAFIGKTAAEYKSAAALIAANSLKMEKRNTH